MKNVLILTYWSYPDGLIQSYTLPYIKIIRKNLPPGSSITLLTLEKDKSVTSDVNRTAIVLALEKEGITWLPFLYKPFGIAAFFLWIGISLKLCSLIIQKKISIIHCWCTPPGAIGYFLSLLLNKKLVLDSYEPHAEAMVENGTWTRKSFAFKLLFWLEKKQTEQATYIISATSGMREYAKRKYGVEIKNFFVKPACVDLDLFDSNTAKDNTLVHALGFKDKMVCVYAGKFGGIYLDEEIFDFIKVSIDHWGDSFRFLILTNHSVSEIETYCNRAGVSMKSIVMKFVPYQEVARYMALANFALTPVKPVPTKKYCTPIKDGEYWALGLPVVIPANISDDSDIIEKNDIGVVLYEFNTESYKRAILRIEHLLRENGIHDKIRCVAQHYRSFNIAEKVYHDVYSAI